MSTQRCDRQVDLPHPPFPGDLYLDPDVPAAERVRVGQAGWRAQATHVWTGTGWSRLVPGQVHQVPTAGPGRTASSAVASVTAATPVTTAARAGARTAVASVTALHPASARPATARTSLRARRYAALEHRWAS